MSALNPAVMLSVVCSVVCSLVCLLSHPGAWWQRDEQACSALILSEGLCALRLAQHTSLDEWQRSECVERVIEEDTEADWPPRGHRRRLRCVACDQRISF